MPEARDEYAPITVLINEVRRAYQYHGGLYDAIPERRLFLAKKEYDALYADRLSMKAEISLLKALLGQRICSPVTGLEMAKACDPANLEVMSRSEQHMYQECADRLNADRREAR
jgi:hypothetical protein